ASSEGARRCYVFRKEGQIWHVGDQERTTPMKSSVGLQRIHTLLSSPSQFIPAMDLARAGRQLNSRLNAQTNEQPDASEAFHGAGEGILDAEALRQYRQRLNELAEERRKAEANHDHSRLAKIDEETKSIEDELRKCQALGGQQRTFSAPQEKAR